MSVDVDDFVESKRLKISGKLVVLAYLICSHKSPQLMSYTEKDQLARCVEILKSYLGQPDVLVNGGYLCFGLQESYRVDDNDDFDELHLNLKRADAIFLYFPGAFEDVFDGYFMCWKCSARCPLTADTVDDEVIGKFGNGN